MKNWPYICLSVLCGLSLSFAGELLVGNGGGTSTDGILRFDLETGNYLGYFGQASVAGSGIGRVSDIEMDSAGNVYASSWPDRSVRKYSPTGVYLGIFGDASPTGSPSFFFLPWKIVLDSKDNLYLSARQTYSGYGIYKYDSAGKFKGVIVSNLPEGYSGYGGSLAIDGADNLYYVEGGNTHSTTSDDRITKFSSSGTSLGVAVNLSFIGQAGGSGDLLVTETGEFYYAVRSEVYRFNASGTFLGILDEADTNYGGVQLGIIADRLGRIFVANSGNRQVRYYDASGQYRSTFGQTATTGLGNSFFPHGFAIIGDVAPSYTVTFQQGAHGNRSGGGALVQTVLQGSSATAPFITPDFGWDFTGWDKSLANITANQTITAQYAVAVHNVVFNLDGKGARVGGGQLTQNITHGGSAIAPTISANFGYVFDAWDSSFSSITNDLTVTAIYGTTLANAGPTDNAIVTGDRLPSSSTTPATVAVGSLTLNPGIAFELGANETLVLNSGPLTIKNGASFTANGIISGSVINRGLLRIPVLNLPELSNTGVIVVNVAAPTTITSPITLDGGYLAFTGGNNVTIDTPSQTNDGIISTDASLAVTGDYTQTSNGTLRSFISGPAQGITYSQLQAGGNISMDGQLQIVFRPDDLGYLPKPGETFDLVVTSGGTITLAPGLEVKALVESTQTGAFDEDSVPYSPFNSGLGPVIDPDDLQIIMPTMFSISLAESNTILRVTYTGPDLTDFYDNAPTHIFASGTTVSEADGIGTLIATLSATSPIPGIHSFALVAGDGSADNAGFSISGTQLLTATAFNFESSSTRKIRIMATNAENRTFEKKFLIVITNSLIDDDDGDDLTEEQELALGTNALSADSDGDGYDDGDEVNAWGTNPLNPSDRFHFSDESLTINGSMITIKWQTVFGKAYKVEGNTGLNGQWMEVPGTVNGTGGDVSMEIDVSGTNYKFFRIKTSE